MRIRRRKKQKQVLLLIENTYHYGRSIIRGIEHQATQNNWEVIFEPRGLAEPLPDWLDAWDGDGIISRLIDFNMIERVRQTGLPNVQLAGHPSFMDVRSDQRLSAEMAADHLFGCGFQSFAYYSYGASWWSCTLGDHFEKEINARGYKCSRIQLVSGDVEASVPKWSLDERKRLQKWLLHLPKPVAIFCADDIHAREVLWVCRQNGLNVPNKVAVLGLDNDPWLCQNLVPPLSSIDANGFLTGWKAAEVLNDLIAGRPRPVQPIVIPPLHITVRQSTSVIATPDPDLAAALQILRTADPLYTSVAALVREVNLSQKTLERRFRRYLDKTPEQEIMRIRIERSKILLRETSLSVESVALKTGFYSQGHFIKAFKREVGMTPGDYRLQARPSKTDSIC
jgi:LacI family transcriptional regulator